MRWVRKEGLKAQDLVRSWCCQQLGMLDATDVEPTGTMPAVPLDVTVDIKDTVARTVSGLFLERIVSGVT
jgi:hypothetical protein